MLALTIPRAMKLLSQVAIFALCLLVGGTLLAQRGGFFPQDGDDESILPRNTGQHAEWIFARFHYDMNGLFGGGFRGFQRWAADYPRSDRQFVEGVHRLTRLDTRTTEEVVDANSDDVYNWPWIFVEDAGGWSINAKQAQRLHDYLMKGGFIMLDDTHGDVEWANLIDVVHAILPGYPIEDLDDKDEIFHTLYDLNDRFQIPGTRYIWGGRRYTPDSAVPKWRAIRDDKGRIMVAICHNSDVGDAWEWADSPRYPERAESLAFRLGINYILYSMTH